MNNGTDDATMTSTEAYLLSILESAIAGARQASGSLKALDVVLPGKRDEKLGLLGARNRCNEIINKINDMRFTVGKDAKAHIENMIAKRFEKRAPQQAAQAQAA